MKDVSSKVQTVQTPSIGSQKIPTTLNIQEIINYDDGNRYEGSLKDGNRNGQGIMYYRNGSRYEGSWENNEHNGQGIYYYRNGDRYEGSWENNKRHGQGIFYYNNGDKYTGSWENNRLHGQGCINSLYYKSQFVCGRFFYNTLVEVTSHYKVKLDPSMEYIKVGDGIHLVAYYKNIHNKQILLLGESHQDILNCKGKSLLDWFKNFKWKKGECLDLFVEDFSYSSKDVDWFRGIPKYATELSTIRNDFRYHYVDYRRLNKNNYEFINYYVNYTYRIYEINKIINSNIYYDNIINFFITGNGEEYLIELVESINKFLHIQSDTIKIWCADYSIQIKKRISKLDPLIDKKKLQSTIKNIYKGQYKFTELLCIPMDIYCILRLFTKFNPSRTDKKCPLEPKNIIIFGGSAHIGFYINFLDEMFHEPHYLVENFEYQCVDIITSF